MSATTFIGNFLDLPSTGLSLLGYRKTQRDFIQEHVMQELTDAEKTNDGSLDKEDFKKITGYYGLAIPAILGESIALLRGKKMSRKEREALTYLGALTGLFDDFFDKQNLEDEKIKLLLEKPDSVSGKNSNERLFLFFYKKAMAAAANPDLVLHYFRKVYDAQIESKKQANPGLSRDEILDITLLKGGVSVLFYRAAMEHPFLPGEEEALLQMGGLMQFGNDIFDVYKDRNGGIHTLLTTTKKINDIRDIFKKVLQQSFSAIGRLNYPTRNQKKYFRMISLCFCSRCFVCFDQLENQEQLTGNVFIPSEYSRQGLVCDMEKRRNLRRSLNYHLKQNIKITGSGWSF